MIIIGYISIIIGILVLLSKILVTKDSLYKYKSFQVIYFLNSKIISNMALIIKADQSPFSGVFGKPVDKFGNLAEVQEGSVKITSSDETVGKVLQDTTNPYAFSVEVTGKAGVFSVNISADADLGDGVKTITGLGSVEVKSGEATGFGEPKFTMNVDVPVTPVAPVVDEPPVTPVE